MSSTDDSCMEKSSRFVQLPTIFVTLCRLFSSSDQFDPSGLKLFHSYFVHV